jgi:hypothetical protein
MKIKLAIQTNACVYALVLLLGVLFSSFELLDGDVANHALLRSLWAELEPYGIDVMQDWNSSIMTKGRPTVAPLANYHLKIESNPELFLDAWVNEFDRWVKDYTKNGTCFLLGVKSSTSPPVSADVFKSQWRNADAGKRLFISYAGEDSKAVADLKKVLERKGFLVFTYINGTTSTLSAREIAFYMTTASERLVFDTKMARMKSGVQAEALAAAKYKIPVDPDLKADAERYRLDSFDSLVQRVALLYVEELQQEISISDAARILREKCFIWKGSPNYNSFQSSMRSMANIQNNDFNTQVAAYKTAGICVYYHVPKSLCPICTRVD